MRLERLLNLLEQHVGGAFQHAIDIFDNDDAPRRSARHLFGSGDDVSHLVDADGHFVGGKHGHVGMSAGKHLLHGFGRLVAKTMIGALQRATLERPDPGGPQISQDCAMAFGSPLAMALSCSTTRCWPTIESHTLTGQPPIGKFSFG